MQPGVRLELAQDMWKSAQELALITDQRKGASLIIDYGDTATFTNTLRGIKDHRFVSDEEMLLMPGAVDLSVNVNFADLVKIFSLNPNREQLLMLASRRPSAHVSRSLFRVDGYRCTGSTSLQKPAADSPHPA